MISWTRTILMPIAIVCLVGALGVALCQVMHKKPYEREMVFAALILLAAAELALVPVWIVRNKPADAAAQGALVATVVHMGVSAAAGVALLQLRHPPQSFLYWLCAFYWSTLIGLCRVLTRVVRSAPPPVVGQAFSGK